jgi:hypothetical protein
MLKVLLSILFTLNIVLSQPGDDFRSPTYLAKSASAKMALLWAKITSNTSPLGFYDDTTFNSEFFTEDMRQSFGPTSDILFTGRKKLIHTVGLIAKANYVPAAGNPYTGVFEGCTNALMRFSVVDLPDTTYTTADSAYDNFNPSFAFKCLVDGKASANLFGMGSFMGQKSWNFFKNDFTNSLPKPTDCGACPREFAIAKAQVHIGYIGTSTPAKYTETGVDRTSTLKFPYKLIFKPNPVLTAMFTDTYTEDFKTQLARIPAGTKLYDVYALADSTSTTKEQLIGAINSSSTFTTSKWGDEFMYFQHHFGEQDFTLKPEWRRAVWRWTTAELEVFMQKYKMSKEEIKEYIRKNNMGEIEEDGL